MRDTKLTRPRAGPERPASPAASRAVALLAALRRALATLRRALPALWQRHRLFIIAAAISVVPRVLASLAFRPALLTADSFLYMQEATKVRLGDIRPSGYSLLLWLVKPLPAPVLVVTTLQHLMGIAIAAIVYGLLRYWGLPAWGACLAALPVLFDTREIALESYILPDILFTLAVMTVAALLITRSVPRRWQCVLAGLLLAYVTVLRGNGLPLAVVAAGPAARRRSPTGTGQVRPSRPAAVSRRAASAGRCPLARSAAPRRETCRAGTRNAGSRA
jgi:hypothetical protein